jgi:hypothetical protein
MEKWIEKKQDARAGRQQVPQQCAGAVRPAPASLLCGGRLGRILKGTRPGYDFYEVAGRPRWCERVEERSEVPPHQPSADKAGVQGHGAHPA